MSRVLRRSRVERFLGWARGIEKCIKMYDCVKAGKKIFDSCVACLAYINPSFHKFRTHLLCKADSVRFMVYPSLHDYIETSMTAVPTKCIRWDQSASQSND